VGLLLATAHSWVADHVLCCCQARCAPAAAAAGAVGLLQHLFDLLMVL
jgi:hypothetical protein